MDVTRLVFDIGLPILMRLILAIFIRLIRIYFCRPWPFMMSIKSHRGGRHKATAKAGITISFYFIII